MKGNVVILVILVVVLTVIALKPKCYLGDNMVLEYIRKDLIRVDPGIAKIQIKESTQAYTENKNTIYVCVRDENGNLYNYNMLVYVILHEYAHVLDPSISVGKNHTDSFHKIFNDLLKKAESLGIYDSKQPLYPTYCGVNIPFPYHVPI